MNDHSRDMVTTDVSCGECKVSCGMEAAGDDADFLCEPWIPLERRKSETELAKPSLNLNGTEPSRANATVPLRVRSEDAFRTAKR